MKIVLLENWSCAREPGNGYQAPETLRTVLQGIVYNHPRKADGTYVTTSHVVKIDPRERTAVTASGTHYQLGEPNPNYAEEMKKRGFSV